MPTVTVKIVRLLLKQYGRYPHDVWAPDVIPIGEVEVEGAITAQEVIQFAKDNFPKIPRCEFALIGWPEQKEFDLEKLIPVEEPQDEVKKSWYWKDGVRYEHAT